MCDHDCFNCKYDDCIEDDADVILTPEEFEDSRLRDAQASVDNSNRFKSAVDCYNKREEQNAAKRDRYKNDPEYRRKSLENGRRWAQNHKKECVERQLRYLATHPEKAHANSRKSCSTYYQNHREEKIEKSKKWKEENKERVRELARERYRKNHPPKPKKDKETARQEKKNHENNRYHTDPEYRARKIAQAKARYYRKKEQQNATNS